MSLNRKGLRVVKLYLYHAPSPPSFQVMTYNEDFLTERSDRERAQAQIHSLKEENESLHQAITLLVSSTRHGLAATS